ncbi:MAG: magnesium transporter, partial [Armatimonadetes bacterium]|nr:magnesium transporter [Armatimonadota bacterium]
VFEQLDAEVAAEALAEIEEDVQTAIIESLEDERAAEIIAEMDPDEAADLLGDLPSDLREDLLEMMEDKDMMEEEEAEDVKELLTYDDESAGGLMTTDYVTVTDTMTAQGVIDQLRSTAPSADSIYYVFVVDQEERLVGVLSLRELIISPPDQPVREFMNTDLARARVDADDEEVAQIIAKYDLLALPVVDEEDHLLGTVTITDAVDVLMREDWKKRLRHVKRRPAREED